MWRNLAGHRLDWSQTASSEVPFSTQRNGA